MSAPSDLPIEDVIEPIKAELRAGVRLVISAPPGAGKTTRVPLALLNEPWLQGRKLILVEPRRIAARAAAERMAATLGERVGQTIGLRSRLDVRTSKDSRIEVVTEGVFSRMILSDPALEGIAGVLFDEFHERSLDADEGLAFALDAQSVLREDLRIILMSATLPADLTRAFFDALMIESLGRAWPVETRYLGYETRGRMDDQVAAAIRKALFEEDGSILAFLPGVAEITRTADRIGPVAADVEITPLYGALSPQEQNAAIAPASPGKRKVVIATDIAESAITIEGCALSSMQASPACRVTTQHLASRASKPCAYPSATQTSAVAVQAARGQASATVSGAKQRCAALQLRLRPRSRMRTSPA